MPVTNGTADEATQAALRRLEGLATNILTSRQEWLQRLMDPRRNLDHDCGYPERPPDAYYYQRLYDRDPIAARVVEVYPHECWKAEPEVYEDEAADVQTPFESAWGELGRSLRGEQSWHKGEGGSTVWEYLRRVDVLSGIGRYGVLLLGLDDGRPLSEPARGVVEQNTAPSSMDDEAAPTIRGVYNLTVNAAETTGRRLLYLRAFPESLVQVTRYESNPTSPRYGLPVQYLLTFADPREQMGGVGAPSGTESVHWSRVLHVCETTRPSECHAAPRMEQVLNRILDLRKVYGADAEGYWRGCFMGLIFATHPSLGGDVRIDATDMRNQIEHFQNGLQRFLVARGGDFHGLPPQVTDPTPHVNAQIEAICIKLATPKRVFTGSERGELASSQDAESWEARLCGRRSGYLTPRLIVPFVDRLILLGVLPQPSGYMVAWPEAQRLTDLEKADVLLKRTQAMAAYTAGQPEAAMALMDWLTREMRYDQKEAAEIVEAAAEHMEEVAEEEEIIRQEEAEHELEMAEAKGQGGMLEVPPPMPRRRPPVEVRNSREGPPAPVVNEGVQIASLVVQPQSVVLQVQHLTVQAPVSLSQPVTLSPEVNVYPAVEVTPQILVTPAEVTVNVPPAAVQVDVAPARAAVQFDPQIIVPEGPAPVIQVDARPQPVPPVERVVEFEEDRDGKVVGAKIRTRRG